MRHGGLKPLQIIAGILFTLAAEIDAPFRRARGHSARLSVRQSLCRPASVTCALLHRPILLRRKLFKPFRVFVCGNEPRARLTVEAAHGSQFFIKSILRFFLPNSFHPHVLMHAFFFPAQRAGHPRVRRAGRGVGGLSCGLPVDQLLDLFQVQVQMPQIPFDNCSKSLPVSFKIMPSMVQT